MIDGGTVGAAGTLTISRTVGADIVITGLTEPFDLHDDVPNGNSTPHPLDRLVSSDESASGDPNEWLTIRDILDEMADSASHEAWQALSMMTDSSFLMSAREAGR